MGTAIFLYFFTLPNPGTHILNLYSFLPIPIHLPPSHCPFAILLCLEQKLPYNYSRRSWELTATYICVLSSQPPHPLLYISRPQATSPRFHQTQPCLSHTLILDQLTTPPHPTDVIHPSLTTLPPTHTHPYSSHPSPDVSPLPPILTDI